MAESCLLCYVTDRTALAPDEPTRRGLLLEKISQAAQAGVDYIQLREKDLPIGDLESLAREAVTLVREAAELAPALLINSRTDVALAVQADGVHLRSVDISPQEVREIYKKCGAGAPARENSLQVPLIGVSCHSPAEITKAASSGATFAVFAPVFEKTNAPAAQPTGLAMLKQACRTSIPVLALGGVTLANARSCLTAGAAGIAAIRLFQEEDIAVVVRSLRSNS